MATYRDRCENIIVVWLIALQETREYPALVLNTEELDEDSDLLRIDLSDLSKLDLIHFGSFTIARFCVFRPRIDQTDIKLILFWGIVGYDE